MIAPIRWLESWRYRLLFSWHARDKGHAIFFAALPLPFVLLGFLVSLAHADFERVRAERQIEYERLQAERRRREDLRCLAENIYFEARGEPQAGQYAVAEVTLNRVRSGLFPATICEVVHEKRWDALRKRYVGAFSWTELDELHRPNGEAWQRALAVAEEVYDGRHAPQLGGALFYHAKSIEPSWAREKVLIATLGRHLFYR